MQKIILDTNVLVSSLIQRGYPFLIVNDLFTGKKIELCNSLPLLSEYYEVLNRKKFSKYPDFLESAKSLLEDIKLISQRYDPMIKLKIIKDSDDNKLLELADESKANFLITGNTNDFTISKYKQTRIVTPKEFWEKHLPK